MPADVLLIILAPVLPTDKIPVSQFTIKSSFYSDLTCFLDVEEVLMTQIEDMFLQVFSFEEPKACHLLYATTCIVTIFQFVEERHSGIRDFRNDPVIHPRPFPNNQKIILV